MSEIQRLDPTLDLRPGSAVRSLVDAVAQISAQVNLAASQIAQMGTMIDNVGATQIIATPAECGPFDLSVDYEHLEHRVYASLGIQRAPQVLTLASIEAQRHVFDRGLVEQITREFVGAFPVLAIPRQGRSPRSNDTMAQIRAAEDAEVFAALDAATRPSATEYMGVPQLSIVGTDRMEMDMSYTFSPEFPIVRYNEIDLAPRGRVQPPPAPSEMSLDDMKKVALVVRRSAWAKLLDEDYPY